jgi:hypothetical protein
MLCTGASPQRCGDGMNDSHSYRRSGAYLVVEPAFGFQMVKEFGVGLTPPEIHVCDLEITPIWHSILVSYKVNKLGLLTVTKVVGMTTIIRQKVHRIIRRYVLWIRSNKFCENIGKIFDLA